MDSLALQCKKKLETFRLKELKDVLTRIGAAKQGKKQVLVEKIMGILLFSDGRQMNPIGLKLENLSSRHSMSREDIAKVIDDIYSRMRKFGASDLASNAINLKTVPISLPQTIYHEDVKPQEDSNVRCPCGKQLPDKLVQCHDCLVWQHVGCVKVSENDGMKTQTPVHFCEICRIQRGDPFCSSVCHPMLPSKTVPIRTQAEGGSAIFQKLDARFILNPKEADLLKTRCFELQIWCVQLDDDVTFRMHWPLKPELRVNGSYIRVTNRQPQLKLGVNGRDDGPLISDQVVEGYNVIQFTAHDTRNFSIGVRIIQRLSLDQVLARIPKEEVGESFDDALSRVRRCVGGGGGGGGDDSDSDLEIVSENVKVNLCCPMSGSRIKIAGRFKLCVHMGCFDLHTFVELNQRARKWQCPICIKNFSINDLIIDPYFNRVAKALQTYGDDVTEIEIKPDGFWRPILEGDNLSFELWRSPYGIINSQSKSSEFQEVLSTVKVEEEFSNEKMQTSVGLKRARKDSWHMNDMANLQIDGCEGLQRRPRSQSSIGITSNDNCSVNQQTIESLAQIQIPRNEVEVNSMPLENNQSGWDNELQNGFEEPEIIILSDTEEEILNDCSLQSGKSTPIMDMRDIGDIASSECDRRLIGNAAGTVNPIQTQGIFSQNTTAPLDFFGINRGPSLDCWAAETQNGSFELFSSGLDSITSQNCHLLNTTHAEPICSLPNVQSCSDNHFLERMYPGFYEEPHSAIEQDYQHQFIHNPAVSADQSLRDFLPHQPAKSVEKPLDREPLKESPDKFQEWISLSLGVSDPALYPASSACNPVGPATPANDLSDEGITFDPLLDSASVLLDLSNHIPRADDDIFIQRNKKEPASFTSNHQIDYVPIDSDSD